jgi:peptidoglycan hydrolase-like protein with peptidoglycan-binding domain
MLFVSKIGCAGIVFLLLTTWISGPRPPPFDSGVKPSSEVPGEAHWNDANEANDVRGMQQTLQDEGHYRGKIDGLFGLRTRASIRGFQKAEKLPVTGQLDAQTAGKLGVRPEVREETGYETPQDKPSAGIKRTKAPRRTGKPPVSGSTVQK